MSEAIVTTIISSICVLVASVVATVVTARKNRIISDMEQKHIKEEIEELKDRVDEHNNYAIEIPLIKQDITYIKEKLKNG